MPPITTKPGDRVRVCLDAKRHLPARVGKVIFVVREIVGRSIYAQRLGGMPWATLCSRSWVRVRAELST